MITDDLISRQDAIDALKNEQSHYAHEDGVEIFYEYNHAIKALKNLPSAQPEIIRCKDCKFNSNTPECGNALCDKFYGMTDQMGYCHHAERRTDE